MLRRLRTYFSTHFAASFLLCLWIVFSLVLFFFFFYLSGAYYEYLLNASYDEADTSIRFMQEDLSKALRDRILQGSMLAVDAELYRAAVLAADPDNPSRLSDTLSLQSLLKRAAGTNEVITIAAASKDGIAGQYDRMRKASLLEELWSGENLELLKEMTSHLADQKMQDGSELPRVWVWMEPSVHPGSTASNLFHMMFPLTGGFVPAKRAQYALIITYYADPLEEILSYVNEGSGNEGSGNEGSHGYLHVYLTDGNGTEILGSRPENPSGEKEHTASEITDADGRRLLSQELPYFGWKLNISIDEEAMQRDVHTMFMRQAVIAELLLAAAILIMLYVFYYLMRPVRLLTASMRQAEQGDLHTMVPVNGHHEIWQVAEEYNRMIETIEEKNREIERQHQETLRSIEQQHAAEWEALESQINAHFICNTVGCISYEAIEAGNHEVSMLLKKLSNILRYTFDQKRQEVMIYQEIAWIDQYLYLQRMRWEDLFDYEILFPEVYGQWPCCKLMFQPFVENSILHGFEGKQSGGMIRLTADEQGDRLRIVIEDNGCGMTPEKEEELQQVLQRRGRTAPETGENPKTGERTGVGIRNAVTRMRMYYGERFEAELWTEEGKGTRYTFLLPIPSQSDGQKGNDV